MEHFIFLPSGTLILYVTFSDTLPQLSEALFMSVCLSVFSSFSSSSHWILSIGLLMSSDSPLSSLFSYQAHPVKFLFHMLYFSVTEFAFFFLCSFFFSHKISYSIIFRAHIPVISLNRVIIAL